MIATFIAFVVKFIELCIFGNVDQYRAGSAGFCNMKCFCKNRRNFSGISYLVVPFGNRCSNVYNINFLESIGT